MNKNLDRRIHPIAEADGLSTKKLVKNKSIKKLQVVNLICIFASSFGSETPKNTATHRLSLSLLG